MRMCTQVWHTECSYIFHLDSSCPFGSEAGKYYITQKVLLPIKVTLSVTAFCAHSGPPCFNEFPLFLVMEHCEATSNGTRAEQVPVSSPDLHRTALCYVMLLIMS